MKNIIISISILGVFLLTNCGESKENTSKLKKGELGSSVYNQYCKSCHGTNGKLGLNGAKDLTQSQLNIEERKTIINNGKNTMTPYKNILSPKEIEAVAKYTMQFSESNE